MNLPTKEELERAASTVNSHGCGSMHAAENLLRAIADGRLVVCAQNGMHEGFPIYGPTTSIHDTGGQTDGREHAQTETLDIRTDE